LIAGNDSDPKGGSAPPCKSQKTLHSETYIIASSEALSGEKKSSSRALTRYLFPMMLCRVGHIEAGSRFQSEFRADFIRYISQTFNVSRPFQQDETAMRVVLGLKASTNNRFREVFCP